MEIYEESKHTAYSVISALNFSIKNSKASTLQGLHNEVGEAFHHLLKEITAHKDWGTRTLLSLRALNRIYGRMAQKGVEFDAEIDSIK